ncbi:DUF3576 domain-containing protein [Inquilinus sp.]|jgi:hypothetical protein|uniref:DUF3576 domain-containing protein n=1 Tax=Inquilinus sp. TaxID=1932117 RepID=UPI003783BFC6
MSPRLLIALLTAVLSVAACSDDIKVGPSPDLGPGRDRIAPPNQSAFGPNGLSFGPGASKSKDLGEGAILGVNAFLWRASLDTVSFMPITSADPFGGTIVTDWYTAPTTPGERYKLNVYILGRELRSDGVRVSVFRQVQGKGGWSDAPAPNTMSAALEDTILTKARQLRITGLENSTPQ